MSKRKKNVIPEDLLVFDAELEERLIYCDKIAEEYNLHHARWSIDNVKDLLADHPYIGAKTISYPYEDKDMPPVKKGTPLKKLLKKLDEFRKANPPVILTEEIKGPRWVDLWIAADVIIGKCVLDPDHCFVEGFEFDGTDLRMITGS